MKKAITLLSLSLASMLSLVACGDGNIKIAIRDVDNKTNLTIDFISVTTYICFVESETDIGNHLPSEVILKADSNMVTVEPYGYSREVRDFKWKATFLDAGEFTITATLNNKNYGTVSYTVVEL